jgi:hypothetical protein
MKTNKALRKATIEYLSLLSVDEIKDLIKEVKGEVNPPQYWGDKRLVSLPNIDAASEFDELMASFKQVHGLTEITEPDGE